MEKSSSAENLMDLAKAQTVRQLPAPSKTNAQRHNAPRISRRKFLALAAVSAETAKEDASLCFATLDTIDFMEDAVESYGPLDVPPVRFSKRK